MLIAYPAMQTDSTVQCNECTHCIYIYIF